MVSMYLLFGVLLLCVGYGVRLDSLDNRKCSDAIVSGKNIADFKGCVQINGSIHINYESFEDMHPNELENFSTVKTITGILNIEGSHVDFKNLSYFRNLELIHGYSTDGEFYTLHIDSTSLESLDLLSLKQIKGYGVAISYNEHLCYANTIKWKISMVNSHVIVGKNRELRDCEAEGLVCDPQCSEEGCWGPGPDKCISCKNYQHGNKCVEKCSPRTESDGRCQKGCLSTMFENEGECVRCHDQCVGCNGTHANNCIYCKQFKDQDKCVEYCPESMFSLLGECLYCPKHCTFGCTTTKYGHSCNICSNPISDQGHISCIDNCPLQYFQSSNNTNGSVSCSLCHEECTECYGPGNGDCLSCKHKKIIHDDLQYFICTSNVTEFYNCKEDSADSSVYFCSTMNEEYLQSFFTIITIITILSMIILCVLCFGLMWYFLKKRKPLQKHFKSNDSVLSSLLQEKVEIDVNYINEVSPVRHKLRTSIEQSYFGNICKFIQTHNSKIETKIFSLEYLNKDDKGLRKKMTTLRKLKHSYITRLNVKLMTYNEVMISIEKIFLFEDIENYILNNKNEIKPLNLLVWCNQIADGMCYLESQGIIHGDLCIQNILLDPQTYDIKIKDFAEFYLLGESYKENKIFICCQNMRYLEENCYQEHKFTHKSDVWAFGVTMYEFLCFGKSLGDYISSHLHPAIVSRMKENLICGLRVPCPKMCKDSMYKLVRKCWLNETEKRPNFSELSISLQEMVQNPDEYIIQSTKSYMQGP